MKSDATIRRATEADAVELAPRMREDDAREVMASSGRAPLDALHESLRVSLWSWSLVIEGRVVAIWGVASGDSGEVGYPWLLTSDLVERHKREFLELSPVVVRVLLRTFPVLVNYVDARYRRAIRWLERLGAHLDEPVPFGLAGLPFRRFEFRREEVPDV